MLYHDNSGEMAIKVLRNYTVEVTVERFSAVMMGLQHT